MTRAPRLWALIVAGGAGVRFGGSRPKQYTDLLGKPVIRRSIEAFQTLPETAAVMVALGPGQDEIFAQAISGLTGILTTPGGATRQESVRRGLEALVAAGAAIDDMVMIHDAARPLVHPDDIRAVYRALLERPERGYALGFPQADALKKADGGGVVQGEQSRQGVWAVQTPQGFRLGAILSAHQKLASSPDGAEAPDDLAVACLAGMECALLRPFYPNPKLTEGQDLRTIEGLLRAREMQGNPPERAIRYGGRPGTPFSMTPIL